MSDALSTTTYHTARELAPTSVYGSSAWGPLDEGVKKGVDCKTATRWILVGIAVASLVIGLVGLLISIGILQVSPTTGLYITGGGFGGAALLTIIIIAISFCLKRAKENASPTF